MLLLGDFNDHYDPNDPSLCSDFGISLYRLMECNNLFQVISEPTRVTAYGANILDLIITNSPGYFVMSGTLSPLNNCDRSAIYAGMNIHLAKQKFYKRFVWYLSNADEVKLVDSLLNFKVFLEAKFGIFGYFWPHFQPRVTSRIYTE